ncbi:MAG: rhomboid family intramembrane serine protease [Luteolibacter sp.]
MIPPLAPETQAELSSESGKFRRGIQKIRTATSSWLLILILLIIQATPVIFGKFSAHPEAPDRLSQAQIIFGLKKHNFLTGDFWQIATNALIHVNWAHLLLNAAVILLLGSKIEHITGKRIFWLLTPTAAIFGGLFFILFTPLGISPNDQQTLVGSSAICFAFLILLTTLSPESKFLPLFLSGKSIGAGIILANLILSLSNPDLPTGPFAKFGTYLTQHGLTELFRISHPCHLGGSIAGFLFGRFLLRPRVTLASLKRKREKREAKSKG